MKIINLLIATLILSGCSFSALEMAPEPTVQKYDLSDPEGDGVITARDNCLDSSSGADVDNNGCGNETVEKIRRELMINFTSNSAKVDPRYHNEIEGLADFLKTYPSANVTIEGHTSALGKAAYNKKLSLLRAEAIKLILVNNYHIDSDRITSVGYGEERLLLKGDSVKIHAKNRRIVAELVSEKRIKDLKWTIYSVDERNE